MQKMKKDTRLDLEAPLLSVRRHSLPPAVKPVNKLGGPEAAKPLTPTWRFTVPFYNSELKSGPVRKPGVVPFVWEQKPGQPKAGASSHQRPPLVPLLPPGRTPNDTDPSGPSCKPNLDFQHSANSIRENKATETPETVALEDILKEEEEDNFSDAVETLSRTESFFMNCSISRLSGIPDALEPPGSFSTDPQSRALMMDRFLPAAQAVAISSSQCPSRKPMKLPNRVENGEYGLRREPLPYQHRPNFVTRYPHDEIDTFDGDDYDYEGNSKGCGILPLLYLKSSFCLLNPMSGMKVGGRRPLPPPSREISNILHCNVPLSQAEDEMWESVYKHKLGLGVPHQGEVGSKSTSKSIQHVQWSDSPTLDGSSSCPGSREALVGIVKRDTGNDRNDGSESFDKDGERYWAISSSHGSQQGSGVFSPTKVDNIHVGSGVLGNPQLKHSSIVDEMDFKSLKEKSKSANVISEVRLDNQRMERCPLQEDDNLVLQSSRVIESDMLFYSERSAQVVAVHHNAIEHVDSNDGSLFLKGDDQSKNNPYFLRPVLPPPLPKTPSESWLSRTLPTVSAKVLSGQSIFDIHVPQRKHAFYSSFSDPRQESDAKPLESQHPRIPRAILKQKIAANFCELQQCQVTPDEVEKGVKHFEPRCDTIVDIKPLKPPHRQIRFADVLMVPLSPRSEM